MAVSIEMCRMQFNGKLLRRGFWLYVWDIREDRKQHLYVGRTGDASSANASSPFRRIGQHLDTRLNAKGNALLRQLRRSHVDPESCTFEMTAIGPIFEEQETWEAHRPLRDRTASLEGALADELKRRGYHVLGHHPSADDSDSTLRSEIIQRLDGLFPDLNGGTYDVLRFLPIKLPAGSPSIAEMIIRDRGEW